MLLSYNFRLSSFYVFLFFFILSFRIFDSEKLIENLFNTIFITEIEITSNVSMHYFQRSQNKEEKHEKKKHI